MNINNLKTLESNEQNLVKVNKLLLESTNATEYQELFLILIRIFYDLKNFDAIIEKVIFFEKDVRCNKNNPSYYSILTFLSKSYLYKYDLNGFININRELFNIYPFEQKYLALINHYEMLNHPLFIEKKGRQEEIETLEQIINYMPPSLEKVFYTRLLIKLYLEKNQVEAAAYITNTYNDEHYDFSLEKIMILLNQNNFSRVLIKGKELLKLLKQDKALNADLILETIIVITKAAYLNDDIRTITIFDAEYEDFIVNASDASKNIYFEHFINVYEKLGNHLSAQNYKNKLKSLNEAIKKSKITPLTDAESNQQVSAPNPVNNVGFLSLTNQIDLYNELHFYYNNLNQTLSPREQLRHLLSKFEALFMFKELFIYDASTDEDNLFWFKKSLLYEKNYPQDTFKNSICEFVLNNSEDLHGEITLFNHYNDVLSTNTYEDSKLNYLYAFSVGRSKVLLIHIDDTCVDSKNKFDFLKLFSLLLESFYKKHKFFASLLVEKNFQENLIDSSSLAFYYEDENQNLVFNANAHNLLGSTLITNKVEYLKIIKHLHDQQKYNFCLNNVKANSKVKETLIYELNNGLFIKETMQTTLKNSRKIIVSILENYTATQELLDKITLTNNYDPFFNVKLEEKLTADIIELYPTKVSLCLIELDYSILDVYSELTRKDFILEFINLIKNTKLFSEIYYLKEEFSRLVLTIASNDNRKLESTMIEFQNIIRAYELNSIKYFNFSYSAGLLKFNSDFTIRDYEKVKNLLKIALESASKKHALQSFHIFEHSDKENFLQDNLIIDSINSGIDNNQYELGFKPIIDFSANSIIKYQVQLELSNLSISNKYLLIVAKRRKLLEFIDKHLIKLVCEFLVSLKKETHKMLNIVIPISIDTFNSSEFCAYLINVLESNNLKKESITLFVPNLVLTKRNTKILKEFNSNNIFIETDSIDNCLQTQFQALHYYIKSFDNITNTLNYLSTIIPLLNSLNTTITIHVNERNTNLEKLKELNEVTFTNLTDHILSSAQLTQLIISKSIESNTEKE